MISHDLRAQWRKFHQTLVADNVFEAKHELISLNCKYLLAACIQCKSVMTKDSSVLSQQAKNATVLAITGLICVAPVCLTDVTVTVSHRTVNLHY